jgi:hypothetical protein
MVPRTSYALEVQYMNGRHTRNKRVMKRVSNALMTRECHADVVRMLRASRADVMRKQMRRASCATSSSKCDARITRVAPDVRSALHSMGYLYGQYCIFCQFYCIFRLPHLDNVYSASTMQNFINNHTLYAPQ